MKPTDTESAKTLLLADGAQIDANEEYPLNCEVGMGPGGDHFHISFSHIGG